jgi:hypothetical protein
MRIVLKGLVAVALVGLLDYGVTKYQMRVVESFCEKIAADATPTDVLEQARREQLPAFDVTKERGVVEILNHRAFYFRFACEVEFRDNHPVSRRVIAAD